MIEWCVKRSRGPVQEKRQHTPERAAAAPSDSSGLPVRRASCSPGSLASRSTVRHWEISFAAHTSARRAEKDRPA